MRVTGTWTAFISVALATVACCAPAHAATIPVTTQLDVLSSSDGQCSLPEAINAQYFDTPSGGVGGECPAGSPGHDTITLPAGLYPLSGTLGFLGHATIAGAGPTQAVATGSSTSTPTAATRAS